MRLFALVLGLVSAVGALGCVKYVTRRLSDLFRDLELLAMTDQFNTEAEYREAAQEVFDELKRPFILSLLGFMFGLVGMGAALGISLTH